MPQNICQRLNFPAEATDHLVRAYETMKNIPGTEQLWNDAQELFFVRGANYGAVLDQIAQTTGVHQYTADMVFYLLCSIPLKERYEKQGLSEKIFWDSMADLRAKLMECRNLYGIWGTFVRWFQLFFTCERFALGRLQYQISPFPYDAYKDLLVRDDKALSCHIPSGSPMPIESVLDSLRQAYDFYPQMRKDGKTIVMCHSWMLYEPLISRLPEHSNLRKFYDLFDIIDLQERPENGDFERIFNVKWSRDLDLSTMPRDTSLQRCTLELLESGGCLGAGYGMLVLKNGEVIRK